MEASHGTIVPSLGRHQDTHSRALQTQSFKAAEKVCGYITVCPLPFGGGRRTQNVRPHVRASFGHENVVYQCRTGTVGLHIGLHGMGAARKYGCDASVLT